MTEATHSTVLVVYDSRAIRETVSILGLNEQYSVVELDEPEKLTDCLTDSQPDFVILCAMTKRTSAYDSCKLIKDTCSPNFVPVLVYALNPSLDDQQRAYDAGADDVVKVTIKTEELQLRILSLLRLRSVVQDSLSRSQSLARASAEAADMMLQLEEADRRIREQNEELERMVSELQERDQRIQSQQAQIEKHLDTLQKEMELASALQINLLPTTNPEIGEIQLHDRYVPAAELCGDYYDYSQQPDGQFFVCIADVTGHGVAPALVSVQVRTLARSAIQDEKDPGALLARLNRFMVDTFKQDFLMTMVCMMYDPVSNTVVYCGAGHCPIVHLSADGGPPEELYSSGLPLGITDTVQYESATLELSPGDKLLLYTDGITEVPGEGDTGFFGVERLIDTFQDCRDKGGRDTLDALLRAARCWSRDGLFNDDVTLVLLERNRAE